MGGEKKQDANQSQEVDAVAALGPQQALGYLAKRLGSLRSFCKNVGEPGVFSHPERTSLMKSCAYANEE